MYRALTSFSGIISMAVGEIREISDPSIVKDLINAGYIMKLEPEEPKPKTRRKKTDEHKDN